MVSPILAGSFLSSEENAFPVGFGVLKVYEEAEWFAGGAEIVEALGEVVVGETVDAFEFEDELVFYQDVGGVIAYSGSFVVDGECRLGCRFQALESEFRYKCPFVDLFQEAYTKGVGDFDDGSDYLFG